MDLPRKPFWKKPTKSPGSIKPVYGAQHPPMSDPSSAVISSSSSPKKDKTRMRRNSFSEFANKTEDAWDAGDDDICVLSDPDIYQPDIYSLTLQPDITAPDIYRVLTITDSLTYSFDDYSLDTQSDITEDLSITSLTLQPDITPDITSANLFKGLPRVPHGSDRDLKQPSNLLGCRPSSPTLLGGPGIGVRQTPAPFRHIPAYKRLLDKDLDREVAKLEKFKSLLEAPSAARAFSGTWYLSSCINPVYKFPTLMLQGYLPANVDRRKGTLERKRAEYFGFIQQYYDTRHSDIHQDTYRQIHIDIPRMNPLISLFQQEVVQEIFERILYIWAIRHPASGYVQGINDLVTPFFVVFLSEVVDENVNVENFDVTQLPEETVRNIEGDSYWCTSKLLDGIQDNYTFAQPGIQLKVNALSKLVKRINAPLHKHLDKNSVEYLQFAFRWMNNLLMREIPLRCTIRLWDTYQSEPEGFAMFHLYVCAALLLEFSRDIQKEKDFQGIMLLLQNLPTAHWGNEEVSQLLAQAYQLKYMFADAPNHLHPKAGKK
ncbi:PREDICTED: TBC1 domain family member 22B-like [Priapulus caudatus]|uniref:TBC1 domain family member 22B-like n=1 Tax=Priapulus caudatus TaxID=37621 RepID=A0ABM1E604_PRICU|nr:PREDICTED: TBC1 domain family member 22B-like [Priapulus caudatus]